MFYEKASSTKEKLSAGIRECRKNFDKEYYFKLLKSLPKRIKAGIIT